MMRYRDEGALHLDFYRTLNATIRFLSENYGRDFLRETFIRTARCVYRSIYESLKRGCAEELVEHWEYYLGREGGEFSIKHAEDGIVFTVKKCPAVSYLQDRGIDVHSDFCMQTVEINRALSDGTPFFIETEVTGQASCVQSVIRRNK